MKKIAFITAVTVLSAFSAVSCSDNGDSSGRAVQTTEKSAVTEADIELITDAVNLSDYPAGGVLPSEQYRVSLLRGQENDIGYEQFLENSLFKGMMMNFTSEQNPLQLKSGTDGNAHVSQVFRVAVVDEEKMLGISNVWNYLVSADDRYLGVIKVDCWDGMPQAHQFFTSQDIAPRLNEAGESGRLAVFNDGSELELYGIFEDGRVITLTGNEQYTGSLTYSDIAAEDNIITVGGYGKQL